MTKPTIKIQKLTAGNDPQIQIYHVEVQGDGIWTQTYGSKELLDAFVEGVRAGCAVVGIYIDRPEIPR